MNRCSYEILHYIFLKTLDSARNASYFDIILSGDEYYRHVFHLFIKSVIVRNFDKLIASLLLLTDQ